ncbi:DUF4974 domain-containing protein [Mucilaginibacter paludis]|uniref:DUF4974 domain-containing protein n=1 Tax=Mucilaginibacter paludis TaxID=423351 RepID=UPI0001E9D937|nr:DUF4974 domain-containing protein [Mucilaginibacter paludis]
MDQTEGSSMFKSKKYTTVIVATLWVFIIFTTGSFIYYNLHKPVQKIPLKSLSGLTDDTKDVRQTKNDLFVFNEESLQTVLPKIARHYDMEVVFTSSAIQNMKLSGSFSKTKDLNHLLEVLKITLGVRFRVEGNKILVLANPYR